MLKLLAADLHRLFRLRSFHIFLLFTIVADIAVCFLYTADGTGFNVFTMHGYMSSVLLIESAVVTGYFIGSEFTCGTVRNKIVAGFSRLQIFISYYLISFIGVVILTLVSYAVIAICGFASGGGYKPPDGWSNAVSVLLILLFWLVCSSFFTALYVNTSRFRITRKSRPILKLLHIAEGGLFVVVVILSIISATNILEPEYYDEEQATELAQYGVVIEQDPDDPGRYINPFYTELSDTDRAADILSPLSHIICAHDERLAENIIAVLSEIVVFTATGYLSFRKRDIR